MHVKHEIHTSKMMNYAKIQNLFKVHRLRLKSFTFCKANSKYIYSHGLRTALTQKE